MAEENKMVAHTKRMRKIAAEKNSFLVDIEAIQIGNHNCIREMAVLQTRTDTYFSKHFIPCEDFHKLSEKDKKTFNYCHHNVHGLTYLPQPTTEQKNISHLS